MMFFEISGVRCSVMSCHIGVPAVRCTGVTCTRMEDQGTKDYSLYQNLRDYDMQKRGAVLCRLLQNEALYSASLSSSSSPILGPNLPDVWRQTKNTPQHVQTIQNHDGLHKVAIIDGKSIARDIRFKVAREISIMKEAVGKSPKWAVVLVGDRKDSHTFINIKLKACAQVGIATEVKELPCDCTETELVDAVSRFNDDPSVHGIVVQLPLPKHFDEENIADVVSPEKDVDGFHPWNIRNLAMNGREPLFIPCAPKACVELLLRHGMEIMSKRAVIIGRSKISGLPTSLLLQRHYATVTTLHELTTNPDQITCQADILISDAGIPNMVRANWLKRGAVVIDMGANQVVDSSCARGFRVVGDVCYEEAIHVASAVTPVPGGIGPVTVSMLLSNILDSAKRVYGFP